ncbi:hypothetical protein BKA82DRAFT_4020493 [Pisolithus tinctorius]|nr:hypothetical protein BKA82DRAFT_4020493 [Pisolithus tinctorius]
MEWGFGDYWVDDFLIQRWGTMGENNFMSSGMLSDHLVMLSEFKTNINVPTVWIYPLHMKHINKLLEAQILILCIKGIMHSGTLPPSEFMDIVCILKVGLQSSKLAFIIHKFEILGWDSPGLTLADHARQEHLNQVVIGDLAKGKNWDLVDWQVQLSSLLCRICIFKWRDWIARDFIGPAVQEVVDLKIDYGQIEWLHLSWMMAIFNGQSLQTCEWNGMWNGHT